MKKLTILAMITGLMVTVMGCQSNSAQEGVEIQPSNKEEIVQEETGQELQNVLYITEDEAIESAYNHSGVNRDEVTFAQSKLEYDNGVAEYEVEFYIGDTEYDYELDAQTGDVISYSVTTQNQSSNESTEAQNTEAQNTDDYITQEEALAIALEHAGVVETEITRSEFELDYDRGVAEYEISFNVGQMEYDYELNAQTGEIISFEKDLD